MLPADFRHDPAELLALNCDGIVQDPDLPVVTGGSADAALRRPCAALPCRLTAGNSTGSADRPGSGTVAEWTASDRTRSAGDGGLLDPPPEHALLRLLLEGRCRELRAAKICCCGWGPLQMGLADAVPLRANSETLDLTLSERQPSAVWNAIQQRIEDAVGNGLTNSTGQLLAIEGLNPERRRDLLLTLLKQLHEVLLRLRHDDLANARDAKALGERWRSCRSK